MAKLEGLDQALKNLHKLEKKIIGKTQKGVYRGALHIKKAAASNSPIVTGNLRASSYVLTKGGVGQPGGDFKKDEKGKLGQNHSRVMSERKSHLSGVREPVAEVGFSANYAALIHENPNAGKLGGQNVEGQALRFSEVGGSKFLEKAVKESQGEVLRILAKEAQI